VVVATGPIPIAPERSRTPWIIAAVAVLAAVATIGVVAGMLAGKSGSNKPTLAVAATVVTGATSVGASATQATVPPTVVATTTSTTAFVVPTAPTDPAVSSAPTAQAVLDNIVAQDRPRASAGIVEHWVPQVSSKYNGVRDKINGATYTYATILADYQQWVTRYPDAMLLASGDYTSYDHPGYYIVVIPRTFSSGAEAVSWCRQEGLRVPDRCLGKFVSVTRGVVGTTVLS
jgi:serine/threonine-protein kinase